jgi:FixJ family two-component response regulator
MTTIATIDGTHPSTSRAADTPIVFVVNEDASVREWLALLIETSGWQPATFASAHAARA